MVKRLLWLIVSCAAAFSLAVVSGIVNPGEKINALWLVTAAGCFYAVAYRFYAAFLAARVLSLDPAYVTPAQRLNDGVDYHPTNRWVLFGHHFAAIAGAGPLIGPMLALQELGSHIYKPLSRQRWIPGIILTSVVVVGAWSYLIYSGSIATIWPMFGVSNQLLAAIAFGVGTTVIIKSGKIKYAWVTFIPMLFMFSTTLTASWELIGMFLDKAAKTASAAEALHLKTDALLVAVMAALAVIILADMLCKWYGYLAGERKVSAREVSDVSR